jgi:L-threonylcarbamoyladenylate synthase
MGQIKKAVRILKNGGVVAYPTETVYGLGADVFCEKAVKKVFALKGRDFKKPLSIAVSSFKMIEKAAKVTKDEMKVLKKLLPGPITFLLPKKDKISDLITAGSSLVGIRFPEHKTAFKIIKKFNSPITSTSANLSGETEIFKAEDINLPLDFVVRGECRHKKPSTVVDLKNKKIVRKGVWFNKIKKGLN